MRPMNTIQRLLLTVACCGLLSACTDETPEYIAQRLTMRDLNSSAGYVWFPAETGAYTPNTEMVDVVRRGFGTGRKVMIFVRPTCSCTGTQRLFPQVMKTFMEAGIDTSAIAVYSVRGTSDRHPYEDRFTLTKLPAFFQLKDDVVTTFIDEANYSGSNADTLVANAIGR